MSDDVDGLARVPAIRSEFRLQYEPAQEAHVLLYPEGMVKLNFAAAAILERCDGKTNTAQIIASLEAAFEQTGLRDDVLAFMEAATGNGWIEFV